MKKTDQQKIADALWYLKKPGQNPKDEAKAIEILTQLAGYSGKDGKKLIKDIKNSKPKSDIPWKSLKGVEIAVIPGHQPGGGTRGERKYNIKIARHMKKILSSHGAKVLYYEHSIKAYGKRQNVMRETLKKKLPKCLMAIELHYNAAGSAPSASGHHFQYLGAEKFAKFAQKEFQKRFPQSRARRSFGIYKNSKGNGSGFLKKSPVNGNNVCGTKTSDWSH